ncbi:MAG: GPI anchored serine-threonine rich family protein, partial [Promethearchaeota archaeon]
IPSGLDNSTQYQIKITDATNPAIEDISDNFEIFTTPEVDSLTVTNPSSLTAWEMGTSHTITWTSTGSITNVKIELFKDGVLVLLITASTANDGSYTWDIPTDLEDGIDYQIKISDVSNPATYDESPDFAITSIDLPEDDDGIPGYNLYIVIGILCVVSVILLKNRKNIKPK